MKMKMNKTTLKEFERNGYKYVNTDYVNPRFLDTLDVIVIGGMYTWVKNNTAYVSYGVDDEKKNINPYDVCDIFIKTTENEEKNATSNAEDEFDATIDEIVNKLAKAIVKAIKENENG